MFVSKFEESDSAMAAATSLESVRHAYRTLYRLIQRLPEKNVAMASTQLRETFRQANKPNEALSSRMQRAGEQIAYLRIITPKERPSDQSGQWIYKDGKRVEGATGTTAGGRRVHTNWDGNNLDPCSVKRHRATLKRAGFKNNLHAKGLF
jgi:hypothetical protein